MRALGMCEREEKERKKSYPVENFGVIFFFTRHFFVNSNLFDIIRRRQKQVLYGCRKISYKSLCKKGFIFVLFLGLKLYAAPPAILYYCKVLLFIVSVRACLYYLFGLLSYYNADIFVPRIRYWKHILNIVKYSTVTRVIILLPLFPVFTVCLGHSLPQPPISVFNFCPF